MPDDAIIFASLIKYDRNIHEKDSPLYLPLFLLTSLFCFPPEEPASFYFHLFLLKELPLAIL